MEKAAQVAMLVLEIAAGIVLAYTIIRFAKQLTVGAVWLVVGLVAIIGLVFSYQTIAGVTWDDLTTALISAAVLAGMLLVGVITVRITRRGIPPDIDPTSKDVGKSEPSQ